MRPYRNHDVFIKAYRLWALETLARFDVGPVAAGSAAALAG
jgi:hypothetical protein